MTRRLTSWARPLAGVLALVVAVTLAALFVFGLILPMTSLLEGLSGGKL